MLGSQRRFEPAVESHLAQERVLGVPGGVEVAKDEGQESSQSHGRCTGDATLQHGYAFVFDYKRKQRGVKASFKYKETEYVLVDGTWYLGFIPDELANATYDAARPLNDPRRIDEETLMARIKAREDYQLTRFGLRDDNGYQRYTLPHPDKYIAYDPHTGELLEKPTNKTVTIPMSIGLKWQQKHPYLSENWTKAFNLRSGVERKNRQLKHTRFEGLDDADKRTTRGYASHALSVGLLTVAHNIRTIDNHLRAAEGIDTKKSSRRQSRRLDEEKLLDIRKQRDGRTAA